MELPVTIVIKAPSQRIGDQTVDCMLDWTVRKLKRHLTDVYPSKPNEQQQKLIYSGKLLQDHLTLKEVLRTFEDGSTKHTVHLVCANSPKSEKRSTHIQYFQESQSHSRQSSSSSTQSQASIPDTEGLRHRANNRNPSPNTPHSQQYSAADTPNVFNAYSPQMPTMDQFAANINQLGGFPAEAAMFPGMMPGAGMAYSPEQYMWMQQMYTQYMAQYMQYYQQGGYQYPADGSASPVPGQQQQQQQQNAQDNAGNQVEDNDDMDDADEEFRQRDWLDYLYTFSRFMVLLGIVYFYSSMTRFFMVAAFFIVVYAYQMGWFRLLNGRRRGQRNNAQNVRNPDNAQNVPPREQNAEQENIQQEENREADTSEGDTTSTQTTPEQPAEPGFLQITWTFVSTFFTSLFPAPPPAVNVN